MIDLNTENSVSVPSSTHVQYAHLFAIISEETEHVLKQLDRNLGARERMLGLATHLDERATSLVSAAYAKSAEGRDPHGALERSVAGLSDEIKLIKADTEKAVEQYLRPALTRLSYLAIQRQAAIEKLNGRPIDDEDTSQHEWSQILRDYSETEERAMSFAQEALNGTGTEDTWQMIKRLGGMLVQVERMMEKVSGMKDEDVRDGKDFDNIAVGTAASSAPNQGTASA